AKRVGAIIKSCYLGRLRALEAQNKPAFVNVEMKVSFEDTSDRFQIFGETPPESIFDFEFYAIRLGRVWVSSDPVTKSVGPLARCEDCGRLGGSKSFVGNNPLWEQTITFAFKAPKAATIAKEFEKEPEITDCLVASA